MNNADSTYHWKGYIRFSSIGQDLFHLVLIGYGNNPDRIGKTVYKKAELPEIYTRFIESGYSFTHFSVKGSNTVRNWRTGEALCTTNSFLDSILVANIYSIGYELKRTRPVDIDTEFENEFTSQHQHISEREITGVAI